MTKLASADCSCGISRAELPAAFAGELGFAALLLLVLLLRLLLLSAEDAPTGADASCALFAAVRAELAAADDEGEDDGNCDAVAGAVVGASFSTEATRNNSSNAGVGWSRCCDSRGCNCSGDAGTLNGSGDCADCAWRVWRAEDAREFEFERDDAISDNASAAMRV